MKRALPLLLFLGACNSAAPPDDPTLPKWSKSQIASLRQWVELAPREALPRFDVSALDKAAEGWDDVPRRRAATALAEQLGRAFLHGCAAPADRQDWHIDDSKDSADLRDRLVETLRQSDNLDALFNALRPDHPDYAALRAAYLAETEPARRTTLARNLERWRWLPQQLGQDYVFVNVPAFEVGLWKGGALAQSWPAIVGKTATPTPALNSTITAVTINPWWQVPKSIIDAGGRFSARGGYVRTRGGAIRQRPGPRNALGRMKVEMGNPYAIYLHDTPNRSLFGASFRAFSHGCVRVGDALDFASTLLEGMKTRDDIDVLAGVKSREEVRGLMSRPGQVSAKPADQMSKTVTVKLVAAMPVYIAYFTAAPRSDGSIGFLKDLYGHDSAIGDPANPDRACNAPSPQRQGELRYIVTDSPGDDPGP